MYINIAEGSYRELSAVLNIVFRFKALVNIINKIIINHLLHWISGKNVNQLLLPTK